MAKSEYDPEIQSVIDRFIKGEIPIRSKTIKDPAKEKRNLPKVSQTGWADPHEEAVDKVEKKRKNEGNYYEKLQNRGLNQREGDDD